MTEPPRDWDREMADIDRTMARQGNAPAPGTPAVRTPGYVDTAPVRRRSVALTWFWVALAVALTIALQVWPYQRACGLQLAFYLGAAGVTAVIALVGALASWSHRRGFAHVVCLLVLLWAGAVALREVLPRVGYARTSLTWMCPSEPPAAARLGPAAAPPATAPAEAGPTAPAPR